MKPRYRWPLGILALLVVLLVVLQLALPLLVRNYLNGKLANMGEYSGHIADVDLALWRGAYRINGLSITKRDGKVPVPLLDAPLIDLAISWHSLWYDHAVVGEATFTRPVLNFVDGGKDNDSASQTGGGTDWRAELNKIVPFTLNQLQVIDGTLAFRNFTSKPPVNLKATSVQASLYNLTNVQNPAGSRDARFEGHAQLFGEAPLSAEATFDPMNNFEDFELRLRATGVELRRLNDFASAYGKFDFNKGSGDLVIEAQARKAEVTGYIKPLLHDVEVFNWQQDVENRDKSVFRSVWEALVGGTESVLKNQAKNQFATRVDLSGNVHQQNVSAFQAFLEILRNGFIRAFNARYEQGPPSN
ncbi:DUF748 domain-containing protein [Pseudomonas sp. NPDC007930]|uniref:DUF748 domain-containing protein n=1 Tax=Pseudomonas sp. NPDC007930 TaxID=3364417 RepID=UPI0036EDA95C